MTRDERILITGGAGFIGTHLTNTLVATRPGVRIEIVDDLSSSSVSPERFDFFRRKNILFRHMTVEEFRIPTNVRYSEIYHLACRVGPAHVTKYSGRMAGEISRDAEKMANLALRDGAPLISISTSEVYGEDPHGKPQHEGLPLVVPTQVTARLEYTVAKLMTEILLINLAQVQLLRANLIRPFNIVGPFQTGEGGFVLPRFVEAALQHKPLTVFGDGTQVRSFTHVSDLVQSLVLIMESDVNQKIYNVGTPQNTCTINYLAKRVIELLDSRSVIRHVDPKIEFGPLYSDAPSKIPDIALIETELGWRPEWSLDQIIQDYALFLVDTKFSRMEASVA